MPVTAAAQSGLTAWEADAIALPLAVEASGDSTILTPSFVEDGVYSGLKEPVDPLTGRSAVWRFRYTFGEEGLQGDRRYIRVTVGVGQTPRVEAQEYLRGFPGNSDPVTPLPPGWVDSGTILQAARTRELPNGWSGQIFLDTYPDAVVTLSARRSSEYAVEGEWRVQFSSAHCRVGISYSFTSSGGGLWGHGTPASAPGICYPSAELAARARFSPLGVGNRWDYQIEGNRTGQPPPHLSFIVTGDTVIAGTPYAVVLRRAFNEELELVSEGACACRVTEEGIVVMQALWGGTDACQRQFPFSTAKHDFILRSEAFLIGSENLSSDSTTQYVFAAQGPGGSGGGEHSKYAAGIGAYAYTSWERMWRNTYSWSATLQYARIDGRTYGTTALGNGELPDSEGHQFAIRSAYPNPFHHTLNLVVTGAAAGEVALEVFDLLGRQVASGLIPRGEQGLDLQLSDLAGGVYVVRATDASGRHAATSIVRM